MSMTLHSGRSEIRGGRVPGEAGAWLFIAGDAAAFTLFFTNFFVIRLDDPALFAEAAGQLNERLGMFNTLLLLTSSWLVARAVHSARRGQIRAARRQLLFTLACGFGFCTVKLFEYSEKFAAGISAGSNDFFMLYFTFTGVHLFHVLLGMGVLAWLVRHLDPDAAEEVSAQTRRRNLESGATFWHLVDLLWIVFFAMFYLVR